MSQNKKQFTIGFEALKDKPTYAVNGAWGGTTPDGSNIVAHVFVERYSLPNYLTYDSEADAESVRVDRESEQRISRADITREVQASLVMTPESALRFAGWLREKAMQARVIRQQFIDMNGPHDPEGEQGPGES